MENTISDKMGTPIPLVYDNELRFYIQYFIGMELLKNTMQYELHFDSLKEKFDSFFVGTKIPAYTKYQFILALQAIEKYTIKKRFDLYKISKITD